MQALRQTLADMMAENRQKDLLIVGTMSNFFDIVNMTMLWALSAEDFCPAKENQLTYFVQNAMGLFEFPFATPFLVGKVETKEPNTSTDFCCSSSNCAAIMLNFLDCMCHSSMEI
jgi:hypothetical protein